MEYLYITWKRLSQKGCLPQYLSLPLSITHKLQAASDDYPKHRVFFLLFSLSMRQAAAKHLNWCKPSKGAALLPTASSLQSWNLISWLYTPWLSGDSTLPAPGARPQALSINSVILHQGNTWISQYKTSPWSRSATVSIKAYKGSEVQETDLATATKLPLSLRGPYCGAWMFSGPEKLTRFKVAKDKHLLGILGRCSKICCWVAKSSWFKYIYIYIILNINIITDIKSSILKKFS